MTLTQLSDLWRLSTRLKKGFAIFGGDTSWDEKRDRTRSLITASNCSQNVVGTRRGQQWTFAKAFRHIFKEDL